MKRQELQKIVEALREGTRNFTPPLINQIIDEFGHNPFLILIACLLSLRVKDLTTIHVCRALFNRAQTPDELLAISVVDLEKILFKTGFYRNKARTVHDVSREIRDRFKGKVPDTYEELMSIKGVGPKTANLVLGMAFGKPAICVDTHVHRISNRLGIIQTKTAEETEAALKREIPEEYWIEWNKLLVMLGQNVCTPLSPHVNKCPLEAHCKKVGVKKWR